jgi:hypothetical protein
MVTQHLGRLEKVRSNGTTNAAFEQKILALDRNPVYTKCAALSLALPSPRCPVSLCSQGVSACAPARAKGELRAVPPPPRTRQVTQLLVATTSARRTATPSRQMGVGVLEVHMPSCSSGPGLIDPDRA